MHLKSITIAGICAVKIRCNLTGRRAADFFLLFNLMYAVSVFSAFFIVQSVQSKLSILNVFWIFFKNLIKKKRNVIK